MPDPYRVKPDRDFLQRVLDQGGADLKKCFQCATCSVVCQLSKGRTPFPRKEMIWAQWGLKDRLMADPDVWVCHQCNDCSTECPRGARPGDVLAAVRHQSVQHYAVPRFLGSWVNQVGRFPLTLLIAAVLLVLALLVRGPLERALPFGEPHGFYAGFFPHWLLIGFFSFFTGLAALATLVGVVRFWRAMKAADEASGTNRPACGLLTAVVQTVPSIFSHAKFGQCISQASRRTAHLLAFYGFIVLLVVTAWAVTDLYVNPHLFGIASIYPFNLMHPMKILANVGCAVLIVGCVLAIRDRLRDGKNSVTSTPFDWLFVWLLLAVVVTGLFTEILRFVAEPAAHEAGSAELGGSAYVAFAVYFVHLLCAFELLVYLPYSKFAHIVYRTVALVYAEYSGRNAEQVEKA